MLRIDKEIQYSFSFHVFFFSLFSLFCTISIEADRGATSREFRPVKHDDEAAAGDDDNDF